MRDSVSLKMIPFVSKKGAKVSYYDPSGKKDEFKKIKNCKFVNNIQDICKDADLIILHTEWDEFKSLEFEKLSKNKKLIIFDLRNLYNLNEMKRKKFRYFSVGRS